jgi:hypothetical protein
MYSRRSKRPILRVLRPLAKRWDRNRRANGRPLDDNDASLAVELANHIDRKREFVDYPLADDNELPGVRFIILRGLRSWSTSLLSSLLLMRPASLSRFLSSGSGSPSSWGISSTCKLDPYFHEMREPRSRAARPEPL